MGATMAIASRCALLALVLCAPLGCAMWRSKIDPHTVQYEERSPAKAPASSKRLLLTLSVTHESANAQSQEKRLEKYAQIGTRVLVASGRFAAVDTALADPDLELVLDVKEVEHPSSSGFQVLWVITAFIVPLYTRADITATGGIYSGSGEKLGDVAVEQGVSALLSLLLLPAAPSYFSVEDAAREDLFESALQQVLENPAAWR